MVKNLKRTLALMLSVIMIFSSTIMAVADDEIVSNEAGTSAQIEETVAAEAETQAETPKADVPTEEKQVEAAVETVTTADAEITAQPEDASVYVNAEAEFAVETNSKVRFCQWQMAKSPSSAWEDLNGRQYGSSETLKFRALEQYDNWVFRCIVTFRDGSTEASDPATLHIVEQNAFPAQSFGSVKDTKVVAPKGAFPAGTKMDANEVEDTAAVQSIIDDMKGVDGNVLNAVDITFYDGNTEIQPQETVKVTMNVGKDADFDNLTLIHIKANADELDKDGIKTEKVAFTANKEAGTITFDADHFSVFTLTWGDSQSATVHFGTIVGEDTRTFNEFEQTTITFDTSAASISLANTFDGFEYEGTTYFSTGEYSSTGGVAIYPALEKTSDGTWNYIYTEEVDGKVVEHRAEVAAGSNIYVSYMQPIHHDSGADKPKVPNPTTTKTVIDNENGTYTIQLDVSGQTLSEDESTYANVLVVLDCTTSMRGDKWTAAKAAVRTLITTLTTGDNANLAGKIDFSLSTFGRTGVIITGDSSDANAYWGTTWTKDNQKLLNYVDNKLAINTTTGTNWESGLWYGYQALQDVPDKDPTYVIFVTDGDPYGYGRTSYTESNNLNNNASAAYEEAKLITGYKKTEEHPTPKLYGIFTGEDNQANQQSLTRLRNVISNNGGVETVLATPAQIQQKFKDIAEYMLKEMGSDNVTVDDGIPALNSVSARVSGDPGAFEYLTSDTGNEDDWETWTDAPGASYSKDNGVTWDLSEAGTVKAGDYYRLRFTVWPSQDAYDLLADLNNGIKKLKDQKDDVLDQLQIDIDGASYVYTPGETEGTGTWTGGKTTEEILELIEGANSVSYNVLTNNHLNTTYTFNNQTYTDYPEDLVTGAMVLDDRTISVKKLWKNYLDSHSETDIDGIQMMLSKDGAKYLDFDVSEQTGWKKDDIFISCGVIVNGEVKESGHDYYVSERAPEEGTDKTPYWEVDSPVYHPMVINGQTTMLVKVDTAAEGQYTIKVNGKDQYYKVDTTSTEMAAANERVSWVNLTKVVTGENAPADALFTFKGTITEPDASDTVYFSVRGGGVNYRDDVETSTNVSKYVEDGNTYYTVASGQEFTLKIKAGWNVRFLNVNTGGTYSFEELDGTDMPAGFVFDNAKTVETLYSAYGVAAEGYPITTTEAAPTQNGAAVSGKVVTGRINKTNTDYTVTYTNNCLGEFYVYHSSNNKVERYSMAVNGQRRTSFNIFERTAPDTLYGGYYTDYAGKGKNIVVGEQTKDFDASIAASLGYTKVSGVDTADDPATANNKQAYTCQYIADENRDVWKSDDVITVNGRAMKPTANTVYYLKEVPEAYLLPYTHYTYKKGELTVMNMWYLSALDDLNYKQAGFFVQQFNPNGKKIADKVVETLKITAQSSDPNTSTVVTLSPKSIFGNKPKAGKGVQAGYLSYWTATDLIQAGNTSTFTPYWWTEDEIYVCGVKTRTVNFGNGKVGPDKDTNMSITDNDNNDNRYPVLATE